MVGVNLQQGEIVDKMIKRFKKKYEKAGILKEFKRRNFHLKPSIGNKAKRARAKRKVRYICEERNS